VGAPERIGRFEIGAELARGERYTIYASRDGSAHVTLLADRAEPPVSHEGFVPVLESGEHDGKTYFATPVPQGAPLAEGACTGDPIGAARIALGVGRALQTAGAVHAHLSPARLIRDDQGRILIEGLGRPADPSAYLSPEQAGGGAGDARSQVYGLGATLYALAAGQPPFADINAERLLLRVATEDPVPPRRLRPEIPLELETIIRTAMDKEPDRRYAGVAEMADDLGRLLAGQPIVGRARTRVDPWAAAAFAALVVACALGYWGLFRTGPESAGPTPGAATDADVILQAHRLFLQHRWDEADRLYATIALPDARRQRFWIALKQDDLTRAEALIAQMDPADQPVGRARLALARGRPQEALELVGQAPGWEAALVRARAGGSPEAVEEARRLQRQEALKLQDPVAALALMGMSGNLDPALWLRVAEVETPAVAEALLTELILSGPTPDPDWIERRARAREAGEMFYEAAIDRGVSLAEVLRLDPEDPDALACNDFARMAQELEQAPPDRRGEILFRMGRYERAIEAFEQAEPTESVMIGRTACVALRDGSRAALGVPLSDSSRARLLRAALLARVGGGDQIPELLYPVLAERSHLPVMWAIGRFFPNLEEAYGERERAAVRANLARLTAIPPDERALERYANRHLRTIVPLLEQMPAWTPPGTWRRPPAPLRAILADAADDHLLLRAHAERFLRALSADDLGDAVAAAVDPLLPDPQQGRAWADRLRARQVADAEARARRLVAELADGAGLFASPDALAPVAAALGRDRFVERMDEVLQSAGASTARRAVAARALARVAPDVFERRLRDRVPGCVWALPELPADDHAWLEAPEAVRALVAATRAGREDAFAALESADPDARAAAVLCVASRGDDRALAALLPLAQDRLALEAIFGEPPSVDPRYVPWQAALRGAPAPVESLGGASPGLEEAILRHRFRPGAERVLSEATPAFVRNMAPIWPDLLPAVELPTEPAPQDPVLAVVLELMASPEPEVRRAATVSLLQTSMLDTGALASLLDDRDPDVAAEAMRRLAGRFDERVESEARKRLTAPRPMTRELAARLLAIADARDRARREPLLESCRREPTIGALVAQEARRVALWMIGGSEGAAPVSGAGGPFFVDAPTISWRPNDAAGVSLRRLLDLAREAAPSDTFNLWLLAGLHREAGHLESAASCLKAGMDANPGPRMQAALRREEARLLEERGSRRLAEGNRAEAIEDFRRSFEADPRASTAMHWADALGSGPESVPALDRAIELDPADADALRRRAELRKKGGNPEGAALDLAAAEALGVDLPAELIEGLDMDRARWTEALLRDPLQARWASGAAPVVDLSRWRDDPDPRRRAAAAAAACRADPAAAAAVLRDADPYVRAVGWTHLQPGAPTPELDQALDRAMTEKSVEEFVAAARAAVEWASPAARLRILMSDAPDLEEVERVRHAHAEKVLGLPDDAARGVVRPATAQARRADGPRRIPLLAVATLDPADGEAAARALVGALPEDPPPYLVSRLAQFDAEAVRTALLPVLTKMLEARPDWGDGWVDLAQVRIRGGALEEARADLARGTERSAAKWHAHAVTALERAAAKDDEGAVASLAQALREGHPRGRALLSSRDWDRLRNLESFRALLQETK
jgi:tetratricopeptide (TPR) repeat protein